MPYGKHVLQSGSQTYLCLKGYLITSHHTSSEFTGLKGPTVVAKFKSAAFTVGGYFYV